ncbi:DEAD/DEAH box helicase [Streptomyces sp. GXMU-J5]|uniref:DEAD/DEAH box helicase n=2 Tax=Streptomyces beihaiensis TaxID=2984495 RepID=A0ABT3U2U3_9ACTN|nr:DEAD/DEAH box helicase [Streptomyces beihaiensis]MCX3063634.1 DEAD/DEAH box helicase [Streptomyces beihaiensis]
MSVSRKRGGQIGRFGVGVKSVLVVTDAPQFFSRTGSFGFDRKWASTLIREVPGVVEKLGEEFETPVLRMARPLDEQAERAADPILDELLRWATTVVRLPLLPGAAKRLGLDMFGGGKIGGREEFPLGFQLFSPHVSRVLLEDRRVSPPINRVLRIESDENLHVIRDERTGRRPETTRWRVFTHTHTPSPAARADAGELHDRSTIDLAWAVPEYTKDKDSGLLTVPAGRGRFWSFFPTKYEMGLTGILNGAWKTNEDRQNLLDSSPFNAEMLETAARLVVSSLSDLSPIEDPGAYLRLLPGREKETVSWADKALTRHIWQAAVELPSLPDQDGVLRRPERLNITPDLGKDTTSIRRWTGYWNAHPGRPVDWLHPSAEATPLRTGKVEHILSESGKRRARVRDWLEALVQDGTAESSAAAINIVADMIDMGVECSAEARTAEIVLTEDGRFVAPVIGEVFRRTSQDGLRESLVYVHRTLSEEPSLTSALNTLGIREADVRGRFLSVLEQGFDNYDDQRWQRFWELFHQAGVGAVGHEVQRRITDPQRTLRVRTVDGMFRSLRDVMLPGPVVTAQSDPHIAVDIAFHADSKRFLDSMGVRERPCLDQRPEGEDWFEEYRAAAHAAYCEQLSDGTAQRPALSRVRLDGAATGGPLHLLPHMSDKARVGFLNALPEAGLISSWTMQIGARPGTRKAVRSPIVWMLLRHGRVETSQGVRDLSGAVSPSLGSYRSVLPVADITEEKARLLRLPADVEQVPARFWRGLLDQLETTDDDRFVGSTYALLASVGHAFEEGYLTRCRVGGPWGRRTDEEIAVTADPNEYRALRAEQIPALLTTTVDEAETLISLWGMSRHKDVITHETRYVADDEPRPVDEVLPVLRQYGHRSAVKGVQLQRVGELEEIIRTPNGMRAAPLTKARRDSLVLVPKDADELATLRAVDELLGLRLGRAGCEQLLERQRRDAENKEAMARRAAIRGEPDIVRKLLLLIGADTLREGLPAGMLDGERVQNGGEEPSEYRIAQMAFNAHGDAVLRQYRHEIRMAHPDAPENYGGSSAAVKFVSDLKFPESFAGYRARPLEPRIEVSGPRDFPRLHDYQERLAANVVDMLDQISPRRAMLSLPTGAGKTRVAAEAVIRWVKKVGALPGPILWIGQTEELCEQAVQSWKFVWEKVGAPTPLAISRLWSSNEAGDVTDMPHLVVATDAKLDMPGCLADDSYSWLRNAALVIVDEAHTAMGPRYTEILGLCGLTPHRTERPLLGLTATPFRSTNEEETRRLVNRFGADRLDAGIFDGADPHKELQKLGVLAHVEHRELQGGSIVLTRDERKRAESMRLLSKSAEHRLAEDHDRSARIVAEIRGMPKHWPVLVFATSVDHAKLLAARLRDVGITAASVDASTTPADRSRRVHEFRDGRLRVLTNYGVLTQGFDAPATRAVVVARPVYSPNVYLQMIGRGLRGPLNGGEETCLILDVRDNITNFDTELAFTRFEHLWSEQ